MDNSSESFSHGNKVKTTCKIEMTEWDNKRTQTGPEKFTAFKSCFSLWQRNLTTILKYINSFLVEINT